MGTSVSLNAVSYTIPATGEDNWGTDVTNYLVALSTGVLSKAGGSFTLTADADFGASYGLKSIYYKSRGTVAGAGILRLANNESVAWRNAADSANLELKADTSNVLTYNGNPVVTLALGSANQVLKMNSGGTAYEWGAIANANIDASAAIAYSKLALSNSVVNADINSSAAIAYSKLALSNSILNADINSSAAIAYSKLALTDSIVAADINSAAAIPYSKLSLTGGIVNADVNASAAIAYSKLALSSSIALSDFASGLVADEDDMVSNSASKLATQQSIKAYVDNEIASLGTALNADIRDVGNADYTITDSDGYRHVIVGSTTLTADRTVTLPTAADNTDRIITIKNIDDSGTYTVTVDGEGAETIDGATTVVLSKRYEAITVVCDGTGWQTITPSLASSSKAGLYAAGQAAGQATGAAISSGYVGQHIFGNNASGVNPTNGQWIDATSITLTPGVWLVTGNGLWNRSGSTYTSFNVQIGASTTSGNSSTGLANAVNYGAMVSTATTFDAVSISLPPMYIRYDGSTMTLNGQSMAAGAVLYFKYFQSSISTGSPTFYPMLSAVRIA